MTQNERDLLTRKTNIRIRSADESFHEKAERSSREKKGSYAGVVCDDVEHPS